MMRCVRAGPFLALALAAACASDPVAEEWPAETDRELVGRLGDEPVRYGDVARHLLSREPEVFQRNLRDLLLERASRAEADALGIAIAPDVLTRASRRRLRAWEQRVRKELGEGADLALWLQRVLGLSLNEWRAQVRHHTEVQLLQDRLLRYELERSDRVSIAMIVTESRAAADEALRRARAGEDFAALARERSAHATAEDGGALPYPLLEVDLPDARIARALFGAKKGDLVGPFALTAADRTVFQLYRVEDRQAARTGSYADLEGDIERGLQARPVHVGEWERWSRRILRRHGWVPVPAER